jgi:hypothetical protein
MKRIFTSIAFIILILTATCQVKKGNSISGYYTRLPFDDYGFTGKFADVVVDLGDKGKFIFSREYSYQPYWEPTSGKRFLVGRLIPRKGDGPDERPDKNNICSNTAIVKRTVNSVTVHWRYAPDLTKPSFADFLGTYNKTGNPSEFYTEYADEYFTINSDGSVIREVKQGCYKLADWNDPKNQFTQKLTLTTKGIDQNSLTKPFLQNTKHQAIVGEKVKKFPNSDYLLSFRFDEAINENRAETKESVTNTVCPVSGVAAYWSKGVSGTCLSFDSYSNAVVFPSAKVPLVTEEITVEAWIAPQEYPFALAAIVDHLKEKSGYFLGMGAKGEIVFKVAVNSEITELETNQVPLYKWTHVVATFQKSKGVSIYLNGIQSAQKSTSGKINDASETEISIGMTRSFRQFPTGAERTITKSFNTNMVFSGQIDEVRIFNRGLNENEIVTQYKALKPENEQPLQAWVLPAGPEIPAGFGAKYTNLQYSPEWDGLWRVGKYSDIVVTFDDQPWRWVFWRGTRYLPSLVTGYGKNGIWSSDQSPESYNGQCFEHMSDMLCRFSNIRVISSTPARVIVHWRNSSASIGYIWPILDENGWGIWTDEYWTVYPDGVSVRNQLLHNGTGEKTIEMNQNEILHHAGQTTEDVLLDDAVTVSNPEGLTETFFRSKGGKNKKVFVNKNLQYVNLNSDSKQFEIGEIGSRIEVDIFQNVWWKGWNHYPVQLIPSDGTVVFQYDRPASTCPATFREVRHQLDNKTVEAMQIYGLTKAKPTELTNLNRSWNFAPEISNEKGCINLGYKKSEKAYILSKQSDIMQFQILASKESPLENPAYVIKNWGNKSIKGLQLKVNGQKISGKNDYKTGIETDVDGKQMLVIWLKLSAEKTTSLEIITITETH